MQEKFLVTDIETTTYVRGVGKIIEIGITEVDPVTKKRELIFNKMVNPGLTMEECEKAWCVTQGYMTPDEIFNAEPLEKWLPVVQSIIDAYPGITAFNSDFDFWFLEDAGIKIPFKLSCLMRASTDVCKLPPTEKMVAAGRLGYKNPNVQEAYDHFFGKDHGYVELHRGGDDSLHEVEIAIELNDMGLLNLELKSAPESKYAKIIAAPKTAPVKKADQAPIVAHKDTTEFIQEIDRIVHTNNMPAVIGEQIKTKYVPFLQVVYQVAEEARVINFENPSLEDQELARELRLRLVPNRTGADKFKKKEKAEKALLNKLEDHSFGVIDTQSRLLEGKLSVVENFAEEQAKKLKAELELTRSELLKPYVENPLQYPIGTMDQKQFDDFLKSQKLLHEANIKEAQEAAEKEFKKKETEKLNNSRKNEMIPYWKYLEDDEQWTIWGEIDQDEFTKMLDRVKKLKADDDQKIADQAAENQRLKNAEVENQRRQDQLKSIGMNFDGERFTFQRFVGALLVYDFSAVKEMALNEFDIAIDYAKKEIKASKDNEQATIDHKIKTFAKKLTKVGWVRQTPDFFIRNMGEGETPYRLDVKILEGWNDAQLTQKIDEVEALISKREAEKKAASEKKAAANLAKSGDKTKLKAIVESFKFTAPPVELKSKEAQAKYDEIRLKVIAFKKWANNEIEKL